MRWLAIAGGIGLAAAMLVGADGWCAARTTSSQTMYQVQQVVGTLLSSHTMYKQGSVTWYSGELRVDQQGIGDRRVGEVLSVRYPLHAIARRNRPTIGDQVRAIVMVEQVDNGAEVWVAPLTPQMLGRGELLRPGQGATFDLGAPEAKILVKMLAPLDTECHQATAKLLKDLAAREPERVRVQIFDMRSRAGQEEIRRERLTCATVLVNNRYRFALEEPAGKREVTLQHRPNERRSSYRSEDVIAVIEQELRRIYQ